MAGKKTPKLLIPNSATGLLLVKSLVQSHIRKTKSGKTVKVREYTDTRSKKGDFPEGTEVVFKPKGAARARRGVVVGTKGNNYHVRGKRDKEGKVVNYILPKSQVISLKTFQDKGKGDTRYTTGDKIGATRVVSIEESRKRQERGTQRLGMTEEDVMTNSRVKGYIINRAQRLAKQNNMDIGLDRVQDADYADMVSEYAVGMLNALRRETAQSSDKDIQEFKDHLAGRRDSSRIFITMAREGKNAALAVVIDRNKRRKEYLSMHLGEEDLDVRRKLATLSGAPGYERFALPPKEVAISKFLSKLPAMDADLISMKFGLGENEPHTNEQIAAKLKSKDTKYQGEYTWTRNNVATAVKDALVKMRKLGGIEGLKEFIKSLKEVIDLRKSVASQSKTICIDFDGVIADYSNGFQGKDVFGEPLPGTIDAMKRLKEFGFNLIIFTTRQDTPSLRAYLKLHEIPFDAINHNPDQPEDTNPGKPIADIYLDDRAVRFTGWRSAVDKIRSITFKNVFGDMVDSLRGIEKSESTQAHGHYVKKCKVCEKVVGTCRCSSEHKEVIWETCDDCKGKNTKTIHLSKGIALLLPKDATKDGRLVLTDISRAYEIKTAQNRKQGLFLLRKSISIPHEERRIIKKFKDAGYPNVAENGHGFFVKWADGRGIVGFRKKCDAIAFAEEGNKQVVTMIYRKKEKGDMIYGQIKKASNENDTLFSSFENKNMVKSKTLDSPKGLFLLCKSESPKYTSDQQEKISYVMEKFKDGTLKSSSGDIVKDRKMAIAIALSYAKNMEKAEEV